MTTPTAAERREAARKAYLAAMAPAWEECEARKENTTGFRKDVWDEMDEEADLIRCPQCGHEYFSDDNWDDIDPHAIEYAEHLNHAERRLAAEREAREKAEKERDEAVRQLRFASEALRATEEEP